MCGTAVPTAAPQNICEWPAAQIRGWKLGKEEMEVATAKAIRDFERAPRMYDFLKSMNLLHVWSRDGKIDGDACFVGLGPKPARLSVSICLCSSEKLELQHSASSSGKTQSRFILLYIRYRPVSAVGPGRRL